jgi:hypothetical protein
MPVFDIYSKRKLRESAQKSDVYKYDDIPPELRVQLVHILKDLIGFATADGASVGDHLYRQIFDALVREYGREELAKGEYVPQILFNFIRETASFDQVLDVIELSLHFVRELPNPAYNRPRAHAKISVKEAIKEINIRFLEHGVGYQYESGRMMRVDSQFVHAEVVKPAIALLSDKQYAGAHEEFLNAHKHYREGNYKECLNDCLKAFESTMKTICSIRKWNYQQTDTAKTLIDILAKTGLIPPVVLQHVGAVRATLESGVPTLRNKLSGHGQGATPTSVPPFYAAYALHLTASNIVFLVAAEKG